MDQRHNQRGPVFTHKAIAAAPPLHTMPPAIPLVAGPPHQPRLHHRTPRHASKEVSQSTTPPNPGDPGQPHSSPASGTLDPANQQPSPQNGYRRTAQQSSSSSPARTPSPSEKPQSNSADPKLNITSTFINASRKRSLQPRSSVARHPQGRMPPDEPRHTPGFFSSDRMQEPQRWR